MAPPASLQVMQDLRDFNSQWSVLKQVGNAPQLTQSDQWSARQAYDKLSKLLAKADANPVYAEKLDSAVKSKGYTLAALHEINAQLGNALRAPLLPDVVPLTTPAPKPVIMNIDPNQAERDLADMREGLSQIRMEKQRGLKGEIDADAAVSSIQDTADRIGSIAAGVREKLAAGDRNYKNVFGGLNPFSEAKGILRDAERATNTDLSTIRLKAKGAAVQLMKLGGEN